MFPGSLGVLVIPGASQDEVWECDLWQKPENREKVVEVCRLSLRANFTRGTCSMRS